MILRRKQLLFSKEEQTTAEVINGTLIVKSVVMKIDAFGTPQKKSEKVLFEHPINEIQSSSLERTADKHLYQLSVAVEEQVGIPVCLMQARYFSDFQKLLQNGFIMSHSFYVGDQHSGEISDYVAIDFYQGYFTIKFRDSSPVAFSGDTENTIGNVTIRSAHSKDVGFMVEVSSGDIENIQSIKKKARLGAIAIFTPFPVIATLIPNKKIYEYSEVDRRILAVKIFGPSFQFMAYAPAELGNLESLSALENSFRSAANWID